jgi:hypothetical protein
MSREREGKERESKPRIFYPQVCEVNIESCDTLMTAATGAIFGNPEGGPRQKVVLYCVTRSQLLGAERSTNTPEKLSLALLQLLFTNVELASGNCTKPVQEDIKQLDIERLWAIRCKYIGIQVLI